MDNLADNVSSWSDHGLAGLVIMTLFGVLFWGINRVSIHFKEQAESSVRTARELTESHRDERSEWRTSSERNVDKLTDAIKELSISLRNGGG